MKANAPEKVWINHSDLPKLSGYIDMDSIEYVRTDAFIEKACEWLRNNSHNYANSALGKEYLVNDFKTYIKGE